jgi:CTP:molybdopterin cytidylyltransferase MocA
MRVDQHRVLLVPAAGLGTRLNADRPKPLVEVNGRPMLDYLRQLYRAYVDAMIVVARPSAVDAVEQWARTDDVRVQVVQQASATGMLDAILLGAPAVRRFDPAWVWISWSDQIGVLPETVARLADATSTDPPPALALPTVRRERPYTHFERDGSGTITRLLERREGDRMPDHGESDMGLFALSRAAYERELPEYSRSVRPGGGTGERNFLPFVPWLSAKARVATFPCTDEREAIGINTPEELRTIEDWLRSRRP